MTSKLRGNQQKAIEALLNGLNKNTAATVAGVTAGTLSRWLAEPDFRAALTAETDQAVKNSSVRFAASLEMAADTMTSIMENSEDDSIRLRAADLIISHAQKMNTAADVLERLAALEAASS